MRAAPYGGGMSRRGTGQLVVVRRPAPAAAGEIREAWDAGDAVLVLDPRAPEAEVERILARVEPGAGVEPEVAAVVVTSGTSGTPKAVELTWDGLEASAAAIGEALEVGAGDRWLACLPLHYVAGLAVLGRAWVRGTPVTVLDGFDVAAVESADATLVSLVPTMVRRLSAAGAGRFRRILLGGGPVRERGPNIVATYGLTETWGGVVHDGYPLAGVELSIGDNSEVLVKAPMVMRGYRRAPAETAGAFTAGGWLRTGDAGAIESDGRLRVVDRLKDLIITGGVNVSPSEVEAVLARHPGVAEVCVAGAGDPEWGERVVAHVVPADPAAPPALEDLRAFAAGELSAAKLPRQVVITTQIPRTAGGKPLRRLLKSDDSGALKDSVIAEVGEQRRRRTSHEDH
jgi:O-succinylbenzoic acid--CoA ligase